VTHTTIIGQAFYILCADAPSDLDVSGTSIQNVETANLPPPPQAVLTLPQQTDATNGAEESSQSRTEEPIPKVRMHFWLNATFDLGL